MNTAHKAVLALFLAVFFTLTPNFARAQVVDTPATTAQVEALQQTLIALLTQLIAQLQSQITEILAQQTAQSTQLGVVEQKVDKVVQSAPAQPVVVAPPSVAPQITRISFRRDGLDESTFEVSSNKPLDISNTELWMNGLKTDAKFLLRGDGSVDIVPGVASFASQPDQYGVRRGTVQIKFYTGSGEKLVSEEEMYGYSHKYSIPGFSKFRVE